MPFYKLMAFSIFSLLFCTSVQISAQTTISGWPEPNPSIASRRLDLEEAREKKLDDRYKDEQIQRQTERYQRELQQQNERCNRANTDLAEAQSQLPPGCVTNGACVTARDRCNAYINRASQMHTGGRLQSSELQHLARACPSIAKERYEAADDEYRDQLDDKEDVLEDIRDLEKDMRDSQVEMKEDLRDVDKEIQEKSAAIQEKSTEFQNLVAQPPESVEDQLSNFQQQVLEATTKIKQMSRQIQLLKSEGVHAARIQYERAVRGIYSACDEKALKEVEAFNARLSQRAASGAVVRSVSELTQSRTQKLRERAANSYNLLSQ